MSKNSPRQNYLALKEWLSWMKIKPKKKPQPVYDTIEDYYTNNK